LGSYLLQRGTVVRLGGDVGRAVGAYQPTVSNDSIHQIPSFLEVFFVLNLLGWPALQY
jgi:hypothetical protein